MRGFFQKSHPTFLVYVQFKLSSGFIIYMNRLLSISHQMVSIMSFISAPIFYELFLQIFDYNLYISSTTCSCPSLFDCYYVYKITAFI